jgi:Mg-chelatase subunit ChlD
MSIKNFFNDFFVHNAKKSNNEAVRTERDIITESETTVENAESATPVANTSEPEPVKPQEIVKEHINQSSTIESGVALYNLIILDESGSMSCITNQTISGCNETLQTIRTSCERNGGNQYVSIYAFDTCNSRYLVKNQSISEIRDITNQDYCPNGGTPLFDAIGETVTDLHDKIKTTQSVAMVTIITDGYENASRKFDLVMIKNLIAQLKKEGWVFTFIGANIDAAETAKSMNIDSSFQFDQTEEGTRNMFERERRSRERYYDNIAEMERRGFVNEEERRSRYEDLNDNYFEHNEGRNTPDNVEYLKPNEVFVFGGHCDGGHTGGCALLAVRKFGAIVGQAEGLQGQSYAIPTTGLNYQQFANAVDRFIRFASQHPELRFLVTRVGCGHAGYRDIDVASLFRDAVRYNNILLPSSFWNILK